MARPVAATDKRSTSADGAGSAALVLVAPTIFLMLWSGGYAVAKIALKHVEPFTLLSLRYGCALLILLPLFLILRPPVPQRSAQLGHIMFVGFLIQCVYFGLSYVSFWLGASAGAVALIVSLQPIVVGILAPLFVAERVTVWRWIGLLLGLAGAGLVIGSRSAVDAGSLWGVLAAVGALFGMSTAAIYEKRFGINAHPVTSNVLQYGIGFAMLTPIALQIETYRVAWDLEFLAALAYLVVGNSLIALTLLLAMIRRGEASRVSALLFLVPPLAALIAWALVGEVMPPIAWAGLALAAVGVALATRFGSAR
ncbi:MAG: DMT family transporter [Hyphomicrobiaceae bacterium]